MVLRRIYGVGEVAGYLRDLLEADALLNNLWVRGEISNYKRHTSGHIYFTLKDSTSCLRCVMFRSRARRLQFLPAGGMRVLARGAISVYERDGSYQLYVEELAPDGVGALYQAYCVLRDKLQAEGLFAPEHKKPLPFLPRKVGVVTSPNGAAWHDIVTVIGRRFPGMPVVLAPAAVQGEDAPTEIASALAALDRRSDLDVIITGRGGGSLEELWAFNTEVVARAIFQARLPVISAVGHETDYSIADLAADFRAATPSAAAEIAVPARQELEQKIRGLRDRLAQIVMQGLKSRQAQVQAIAGRNLLRPVRECLRLRRQEINFLSLRMSRLAQTMTRNDKIKLEQFAARLDNLSPLAVLQRGYSLCCDPVSGRMIRSTRDVEQGDRVDVILSEGSLDCRVIDMREGPTWTK